MMSLKLILRLFPWVLLVGALFYIIITHTSIVSVEEGDTTITNDIILQQTEQLGKLELVKYRYKEITEVIKEAETIDMRLFSYKMRPDARGLLISTGEATACLDLKKVKPTDISLKEDTVYMKLPYPELCYFKLDLDKSRLYDLKPGYLTGNNKENAEFIEGMYRQAEEQIKNAALNSTIFEEAIENAQLLLVPLFEGVSGKPVVITFKLPETRIIDTVR